MNNQIKLICIFLACTQSAYCYVDPGSGSLVLQAIIAGMLGLSFYFKSFFGFFKSFFSKNKQKNDQN
jgi:hypothetical protein